ncbi:hypothetical protein LAZ67_23002328 [Cordylochernes scorpioides]|uniref:Transposase n=1 Tax=Cordylochernes scorpioides TaxID=51811 RepID=A0ABY6LSA8_9ARAC|nr:hypothetical protein LAZ67_23002328 [Cordylochernes scorpioides]
MEEVTFNICNVQLDLRMFAIQIWLKNFKEFISLDRRLGVRDITYYFGVCKDTIHSIPTKDLNKRERCFWKVPKILSREEMLNTESDFIEYIITGDETWVYVYESGKHRQSLKWCGPGSPVTKYYTNVEGKESTNISIKNFCGSPFLPKSRRKEDNSGPQKTSFSFLAKKNKGGISVMFHPSYSPELSPCNFPLFDRLIKEPKESGYSTIDEDIRPQLKN